MTDNCFVEHHGACGGAPSPALVSEEADDGTLAIGLLGLMDDMAFALVMTDASCRVLYANRAALHELAGQNGLGMADGYLTTVNPAAKAQLRADIDAAVRGRRRYSAFSLLESTSHVAFMPVICSGPARENRAALVFDRRPGYDRLAIYFYAHLNGLTDCEERVLTELSTGLTVAVVAERLGMQPNTVRTHVRAILAKTGESSLRTLTARLGRLPPVAARMPGLAMPCGAAVAHCPTETQFIEA